METTYIALVHKDEGSDFGVSFPDFPGCIGAGATEDEARTNAREALGLHVQGMIEDGEPIPEPSGIEEVCELPEAKTAKVMVFKLPVKPERTVRVNITLRGKHLRRIDRGARMSGVSRSVYLVGSALARLEPNLPGWESSGDLSWNKEIGYCVEEASTFENTPSGSEIGVWFLVRRCDHLGRPTSDMLRWACTRRDAQQIAELLAVEHANRPLADGSKVTV